MGEDGAIRHYRGGRRLGGAGVQEAAEGPQGLCRGRLRIQPRCRRAGGGERRGTGKGDQEDEPFVPVVGLRERGFRPPKARKKTAGDFIRLPYKRRTFKITFF